MLFNIIDNRKHNEYDHRIDAVFMYFETNYYEELDGGGMDPIAGLHWVTNPHIESGVEWINNTTVKKAVDICYDFKHNVTLYLYDPGYISENFGYLCAIHPRLPKESLTKEIIIY